MEGEELRRIEFRGDESLDFDNIAFILLSSILASVALLAGSIPVLIGAMILAPTFDPLVAVPFGLVNRDWRLVGRGLGNALVLFAVSLSVCLLTVWLVIDVFPLPLLQGALGIEMIEERLFVGWSSIIVALTAGAGGALASASDRKTNLVGVVVALALVPSLAAAAVGFIASPLSGWGGIELFGINFAGIILAGYLVLLLRAGTGKEKERLQQDRDAGKE